MGVFLYSRHLPIYNDHRSIVSTGSLDPLQRCLVARHASQCNSKVLGFRFRSTSTSLQMHRQCHWSSIRMLLFVSNLKFLSIKVNKKHNFHLYFLQAVTGKIMNWLHLIWKCSRQVISQFQNTSVLLFKYHHMMASVTGSEL